MSRAAAPIRLSYSGDRGDDPPIQTISCSNAGFPYVSDDYKSYPARIQ